MKKTLITIGLTTIVVLTLLGVGFFAIFGGFGMGGGPSTDLYSRSNVSLEFPAFAPAATEAPAPLAAESYAADAIGGSGFNEAAVSNNVAATERLVIQNVDMSIVVTDPKARMKEIGDLAVQMGGYVVNSNLYQNFVGPDNTPVPGANMTIRIPSQKLDEALTTIKDGAVDVTYENRSGQDVTSQYVDLQSRLSVKQDAEKKLLEIMDKADKSEDVLAIYLQVQNVQTEIEVLKGQIKYYDESVALSAVSITLVAEETVKPLEIGGWKVPETANASVQNLIRFTQGFTQFLIRFLLDYLWRILLIALPLYGAFLGGRGLIRKFRKSKPEVKTEEEK